MTNYVCPVCRERFGYVVWHCPGCAHHWLLEPHEQARDVCANCYNYELDDNYNVVAIDWTAIDESIEAEYGGTDDE
jgi:hypothetical protein